MSSKGWNSKPLKEFLIAEIKNGYSPVPAEKPTGAWILSLGALTGHGLDANEKKPIPKDVQSSDSILSYGDFLVSRSNTVDKVGRAVMFRGEISNCSYPDLIMRFRVNDQLISMEYLECFLQSDLARKYFSNHAAGTSGSMLKINKSILENFNVNYPSIFEQKKIATFIADWDKALGVLKKLLKNGKAHKSGLEYQLLTGRVRYSKFVKTNLKFQTRYGVIPEDWGFISIGEIAEEISTRNFQAEDLPVLSCSKYYGFVDSLAYFKKKVFSDDTSNYKVVERGDFGFPSNHIEEGSIGYQNVCDKGIVSPIYTVFRVGPEIDPGYFYKVLKTEHYRQIFAANTNASVDRRGSLRWKEFSAIKVPVPSLEEQKRISTAIDQADLAVANYKKQLANLQTQKKALMQQLLTGKRRVIVEAS